MTSKVNISTRPLKRLCTLSLAIACLALGASSSLQASGQSPQKVEQAKATKDKPKDSPIDTTKTPRVDKEGQEEEVYLYDEVDTKPEFPGGEDELNKYLASTFRYPEAVADRNEQGRIEVLFIITKSGSIENVHVIRGATPLLDTEAIRVVRSMPKWSPGLIKDKPVNTMHVVPINFRIEVDMRVRIP